MEESSSAGVSPLKAGRQWKVKGGKSSGRAGCMLNQVGRRVLMQHRRSLPIPVGFSDGHGGIKGL
jgi:hypothetical protein